MIGTRRDVFVLFLFFLPRVFSFLSHHALQPFFCQERVNRWYLFHLPFFSQIADFFPLTLKTTPVRRDATNPSDSRSPPLSDDVFPWAWSTKQRGLPPLLRMTHSGITLPSPSRRATVGLSRSPLGLNLFRRPVKK